MSILLASAAYHLMDKQLDLIVAIKRQREYQHYEKFTTVLMNHILTHTLKIVKRNIAWHARTKRKKIVVV